MKMYVHFMQQYLASFSMSQEMKLPLKSYFTDHIETAHGDFFFNSVKI